MEPFYLLRFSSWWNHAILPLSFWSYLIAFNGGFTVHALCFCALLLVGSALVAALGYIINDYFDRVPDRQVHKPNFFDGSVIRSVTLTMSIVALGVSIWSVLVVETLTIVLLVVECALFILYSAPPVRLKNKSLGIIADALYSRVIPVLTMLSFDSSFGNKFVLISAIWMLIAGVRNILEHQINDYEPDRLASQYTFVRKHGISKIKGYIFNYLLPIEAGLTILAVTMLHQVVTGLFWTLPAFLVYYVVRFKLWDTETWNLKVMEERVMYLSNNYYADFLPLGFLILLTIKKPVAWPIVIIHLVLFPGLSLKFVRDLKEISKSFWSFYLSQLLQLNDFIKYRFWPKVKLVLSKVVNWPIIRLFLCLGVNLEQEKLSAFQYIKRWLNRKK